MRHFWAPKGLLLRRSGLRDDKVEALFILYFLKNAHFKDRFRVCCCGRKTLCIQEFATVYSVTCFVSLAEFSFFFFFLKG